MSAITAKARRKMKKYAVLTREPRCFLGSFDFSWEQRKLGDISEIKTGPFGSTLHADDYVSDGTPIITTEHFKTGALPRSKNGLPQVSDSDYKRLTAYTLDDGDIVFSRVGSVDINALITPFQSNWLFSGRVLRVRPQTDISSKFLHTRLETESIKTDIRTRAVGQTMPSINTEILKITPLVLPSSAAEQEQIGSYFAALDNLITFHQRKCVFLFSFFRACISMNFTASTFSWEQRKLGELALFNPKDELPQTFEYVDLESVVGTEMLSHRTEVKSSAPSRAQRLAHTGDLFYQTVRPYQKNNYLFEKPDNNYVFSTGYAQMRPYVDGYFLLSLVQSERFVKVVLDNCTGTSYPAINANDLAEIEVAAPSDESEAQKIGTIFRSIDNLITLHQRELEKLQNIKKSMLEKMFV